MAQGYVVFVTEINHFIIFKSNSVICYDFSGTAKSGQDICFQELDTDKLISSRWYSFYLLGKEVSGCEDPLMLS